MYFCAKREQRAKCKYSYDTMKPSPHDTIHLACILGTNFKYVWLYDFFGVTTMHLNCLSNCLPNVSTVRRKIDSYYVFYVLLDHVTQNKIKAIVLLFFAGLIKWKIGFCKGKCWPIFFHVRVIYKRFSANYMVFWAFSLKNRLNLS